MATELLEARSKENQNDPQSDPDKPGYVGWNRKRQTSIRVKIGDVVARVLITLGGFGTIIAVVTMCLFLVWVVAPLAMDGEIEGHESLAAVTPPEDRSILRT
ncbi:MAG: hypothetical protein ACOCXA_01520, partial [Planctomycetota bacterium]